MKKFFCVLSVCAAFVAAGCGEKPAAPPAADQEAVVEEEVMVEEAPADAMPEDNAAGENP